MARTTLVTIGTDGISDWVQTPDGQKFLLGPVSVLKLVSNLASTRTARAALKEFLENKQVLLSVDLDKMWTLLPFQRARYSSTYSSLVKSNDCSPQLLERNMFTTASYDSFSANMDVAEGIITKLDATNEKIDQLVTAGKKFDSDRAKADLHKIASRVAEIAQNVDLAQPWVGTDLAELAKQTDHIHGLFEPKQQ